MGGGCGLGKGMGAGGRGVSEKEWLLYGVCNGSHLWGSHVEACAPSHVQVCVCACICFCTFSGPIHWETRAVLL